MKEKRPHVIVGDENIIIGLGPKINDIKKGVEEFLTRKNHQLPTTAVIAGLHVALDSRGGGDKKCVVIKNISTRKI